MPIYYDQNLSTDMILSEVEILLDWQVNLLRLGFFPSEKKAKLDALAPDGLLSWCRQQSERNMVDKKVVERMAYVHAELCRIAQSVVTEIEAGRPLTLNLYDSFEHQCEAYLLQIRRVQMDMADSAVAVDQVTGLRTVAGMRNDIKREQDRFERKGTAFSIAALEIDNIIELQSKHDRRSIDTIYAHIAQIITRSIRSFDDAYFLGRGEYMLVLKHLDFMDACGAADRLRAQVEQKAVDLPNGDKVNVTVAFGITEAVQKDSPDVSIEHAKAALLDARNKGGNCVVEYHEMSPLARYAQDVKQNK